MSEAERGGVVPRPPAPPGSPGPAVQRAVSSATLFCGHRELVILHRGQAYRLRITRADKLILTK